MLKNNGITHDVNNASTDPVSVSANHSHSHEFKGQIYFILSFKCNMGVGATTGLHTK